MYPSRGPTTKLATRNTQTGEHPEVRRSGIPRPTSKQPISNHDVSPPNRKNASATVAERAGKPPSHISTQRKRIPSPPHAGSQPTLHAIDRLNAQHSANRTIPRAPTPAVTGTSTISNSENSRLRRKPSVIERTRTSLHQDPVYIGRDPVDDLFDGTVLGIMLPPVLNSSTTPANPDKPRDHRIARKPLAADTQKAIEASQLRPLSGTPSTRYTTSPFSQLSAPTSISSYSPNTGNEYRLSSISTSRKGPSLPSSPKAFLRLSQNRDSTEQAVVSDETNEHRASTVAPELAHLNIEYKPNPEGIKSPRRPSRDNTPDLSDLQRPFPIIHSDLPAYYATYRKRAPSYEAQVSASPPPPTPPRGFFGFRSRSQSREPTSRADSVVASSPRPHESLITPVSASSRESTPISGDAVFPPTSMFGKFLKHDHPSTSKLSKPAKKLRKGPAAGTGHERYGKFGLRGRTSSISDAADSKRSTSVDSVKSKVSSFWRGRSASKDSGDESDIDNIRKARLSPTTSQLERSDVGKSSHSSPTALNDLSVTQVHSQKHFVQRRESLADLDGFYRAGLLIADVVSPREKGRLRTLHKSQTTGDLAVGKLSNPIAGPEYTDTSTELATQQPDTTDRHLKSSSEPEEPAFTDLSEGKEGNWLTSGRPRSESERVRNFRQRAKETESSSKGSVAADLRNAQGAMQKLGPLSIPESSKNLHPRPVGYEDRHSSMLPFPKQIDERYPSKQPLLNRVSLMRTDSAETPQVLSAQAAQARTTAHLVDITRSPRRPISLNTAKSPTTTMLEPPSEPVSDKVEHSQSAPRVVHIDSTRNDHRDTSSPNKDIAIPKENSEFFAFPERKESELSYTSSSEAASTRTGSTLIAPTSRRFWLGDEDIWNEYNDLLDEVMVDKPHLTKARIPTLLTGSRLGASLQYDSTRSTGEGHFKPPLIQIPAVIQELPTPQDVEPPTSSEGLYRFSRFLQPGAEPTTPYSISDIMAGYSDRTMSGHSLKTQQSLPPNSHESLESGYPSQVRRHPVEDQSRAGFRSEEGVVQPFSLKMNVSPTGRINEHAEHHQSLLESADGNLRWWALITSKWLSFGRVLFSPAHDEIKPSQDCRVLIIDGLGKGKAPKYF